MGPARLLAVEFPLSRLGSSRVTPWHTYFVALQCAESMDRGSYIVLNPKDPRLEIYVTAYDGIMSFLYFETRN